MAFSFKLLPIIEGKIKSRTQVAPPFPIHNHKQREMNVPVLLASVPTLLSPLLCSSGPPTRNDTAPKTAMPTSTNDQNNLP